MKLNPRQMLSLALGFCKTYGTCFLWAALLLCLLFSFCAFFYGDVEATFDNTVLMVKSIGEGKFLHFYEYSLENARTYWPAGYDILLYVFFAVWNLPAIIWHLASGFDYLESPLALLWCKGLAAACAGAMACALYRMVRLLQMSKEEGRLAAFLLLSSLSLTAPVFIAGQYDTLPLFFMLLGLYFYLKGEMKGFYLCFLISIPLKVYGLFLLIPLILLKEKRIGAILLKTAGTCSLYVLLKLLFAGDSAYPFISGSQGQYGTDKLLNAAMEYSGYSLCLFLGAYAAICIYCYWKRLAHERECQVWAVYICFLVFAAFAVFVAINDYWVIFWLPFAVLLIFMNPANYKINVLIETVSSAMYLLYAFINKVYPYSYPELVTERFLQFFMEIPDEEVRLYGSVKELMERLGLQPYAQLAHTLFVVGIISLMVINRPGVILSAKCGDNKEAEGHKALHSQQGILWSRILAILISALLLIYGNLKAGNPILYSTFNSPWQQSEVNLLEGAVFTQDLEFAASYELEELTLHFTNDGYVKDNFGSVWIRLTERDTGHILFETRLGASMANPGKDCYISLDNTPVEPGKVYTLSLEGIKGMEGSTYFFSPWITDGFHSGNPLLINGEYQDCNLYMQIR